MSAAGTGRLVRIEGKIYGAKYREILDENLLQCAQDAGLPSNRTSATIDKNQDCAAVFNLAKAFDSVNHCILIGRVNSLGF